MRIANLPVVVVLATLVFSLATECLGTEENDVVEEVGVHGHINWSKGLVYAKGTASNPERNSEKSLAPSSPTQEMVLTSANLFETVKGIRIDASSMVKDLVEDSDIIREQLRGMVKGAQIVKREYLSDGTVEATFAFQMMGGFAQLALPPEIKHVPEIRTIPNRSPEVEKSEGKPSLVPPVCTGLVLDARGLEGMPAMVPRIVNETGEEIFGPAHISREYAVQRGVAAFETDMKSAQNNPRVMNNPITVRGLGTQGPSRCNYVISNADAGKIQSASENLLFLKQCRVIVVLD
jgi:hypothetical protein